MPKADKNSEKPQDSAAREISFRNWPFYWLMRSSGRYLQAMDGALKSSGVDATSWRVLMILREEECASMTEIADHSMAKLSTMTKIVQRMQGEGLVICRPRASDGRVTEVLLTPAGQAASEEAWSVARRIYEHAFRKMTKAEKAALSRLLEKLAESLLPHAY